MENKNQTNKSFSITFVRHGQSIGNSTGLLQGQSNTSISEEGKEQAMLAGAALSHIKYDQIYASDLDRAFDTASIIAKHNKESISALPDENSNTVKVHTLLRERCFGVCELRPHKEFRTAAEKSGFVGKDLYHFIPEGGEGLADLKKRAKDFLDFLFESNDETIDISGKTHNILVVSHSGLLRQMGVYLLHDCKATYAEGFEFPDGFNSENYLDKAWKNTAKSTFQIEVDTDNKILSVQCTQYACSKHLESVAINKCND